MTDHYECAIRELAACSAAFDRQQEQLDRNAEQIATLQKKKPWVGLTDQDKNNCLVSADPCESLSDPEAQQLMKDVEAKLKEKNCG